MESNIITTRTPKISITSQELSDFLTKVKSNASFLDIHDEVVALCNLALSSEFMTFIAGIATSSFLSIASNDHFLAGSFCLFLSIIDAKAQIKRNETRIDDMIQELRNSFIALRLALESNRDQVLSHGNLLESFNTLLFICKSMQRTVKLDNERLERILLLKQQYEKLRRSSQLSVVAEKVTSAMHHINPLTWSCANQDQTSEADEDSQRLVMEKRYTHDSLIVQRSQQISTELELIRNKTFPIAKRGLLKKLLKWIMTRTSESTDVVDIEFCFEALLCDARSLQYALNALAIGTFDSIANPRYYDQEWEQFEECYTVGTREWLWKDVDAWIDSSLETTKTYLLTGESGMGKSVFCAYLLNNLRNKYPVCYDAKNEVYLCYTVFSLNGLECSHPVKVVKSIIGQLARQDITYFQEIMEVIRIHESSLPAWNEQQWWDMFVEQNAYLNDKSKRIIIIIDALDEVLAAYKNHLYLFLQRISKRCNLFITCQSEERAIFNIATRVELLDDVKQRKDVLQTIQQHLREEEMYSNDFANCLTDILLLKGQGKYLYATLMLKLDLKPLLLHIAKMINLSSSSLSPKQIINLQEVLMTSLPNRMDGVYDSYFVKLFVKVGTNNIEKVKDFFGLLLCTRESISDEFASNLLCIKPIQFEALLRLMSLIVKKKTMNRHGQEVTTLNLYHQSIRDWLRNQSQGSAFYINLIVIQQRYFLKSFKNIFYQPNCVLSAEHCTSLNIFLHDSSLEMTEKNVNATKAKLISYLYQNIIYHLEATNEQDIAAKLLLSFTWFVPILYRYGLQYYFYILQMRYDLNEHEKMYDELDRSQFRVLYVLLSQWHQRYASSYIFPASSYAAFYESLHAVCNWLLCHRVQIEAHFPPESNLCFFVKEIADWMKQYGWYSQYRQSIIPLDDMVSAATKSKNMSGNVLGQVQSGQYLILQHDQDIFQCYGVKSGTVLDTFLIPFPFLNEAETAKKQLKQSIFLMNDALYFLSYTNHGEGRLDEVNGLKKCTLETKCPMDVFPTVTWPMSVDVFHKLFFSHCIHERCLDVSQHRCIEVCGYWYAMTSQWIVCGQKGKEILIVWHHDSSNTTYLRCCSKRLVIVSLVLGKNQTVFIQLTNGTIHSVNAKVDVDINNVIVDITDGSLPLVNTSEPLNSFSYSPDSDLLCLSFSYYCLLVHATSGQCVGKVVYGVHDGYLHSIFTDTVGRLYFSFDTKLIKVWSSGEELLSEHSCGQHATVTQKVTNTESETEIETHDMFVSREVFISSPTTLLMNYNHTQLLSIPITQHGTIDTEYTTISSLLPVKSDGNSSRKCFMAAIVNAPGKVLCYTKQPVTGIIPSTQEEITCALYDCTTNRLVPDKEWTVLVHNNSSSTSGGGEEVIQAVCMITVPTTTTSKNEHEKNENENEYVLFCYGGRLYGCDLHSQDYLIHEYDHTASSCFFQRTTIAITSDQRRFAILTAAGTVSLFDIGIALPVSPWTLSTGRTFPVQFVRQVSIRSLHSAVLQEQHQEMFFLSKKHSMVFIHGQTVWLWTDYDTYLPHATSSTTSNTTSNTTSSREEVVLTTHSLPLGHVAYDNHQVQFHWSVTADHLIVLSVEKTLVYALSAGTVLLIREILHPLVTATTHSTIASSLRVYAVYELFRLYQLSQQRMVLYEEMFVVVEEGGVLYVQDTVPMEITEYHMATFHTHTTYTSDSSNTSSSSSNDNSGGSTSDSGGSDSSSGSSSSSSSSSAQVVFQQLLEEFKNPILFEMTTTVRNESLPGSTVVVTTDPHEHEKASSLKACLFTKDHTLRKEMLIPLTPHRSHHSHSFHSCTMQRCVCVCVFLLVIVMYRYPMDINSFFVYLGFLLHD